MEDLLKASEVLAELLVMWGANNVDQHDWPEDSSLTDNELKEVYGEKQALLQEAISINVEKAMGSIAEGMLRDGYPLENLKAYFEMKGIEAIGIDGNVFISPESKEVLH